MKKEPEQYQKIRAHIGRQLQKQRKKAGLSLEELAARVGISHQQLHKYEKALNSIPADKLHYLAIVLGVSSDYFFEGFVDSDSKHSPGSKRGESLEILVIEDDPGDAILVRKALDNCEKRNTIHLSRDGREALNFLNNKHIDGSPLPDLIFLDLNIPSIEGLSLLKEIKKHSSFSHIPVIVITNSMNDDDIIKSYKAQASGVIRKGGSSEEFNQRIASLVDCWSSAMTLPVID